jgi:nucleoside phosphorylase
VLVLAAMPLELEPLLRALPHDGRTTVEGRTFYAGRLDGRDVVLAMTGVGMENARMTAEVAYAHHGAMPTVFCGVAGSVHRIGDVAVPASWTGDGGTTWHDVDPGLLAEAGALAVDLAKHTPLGDGPFAHETVAAGTIVTLAHQPNMHVGGRGTSSDPFGGLAIPCVPGGGDVLGCAPTLEGDEPPDAAQVKQLLEAAFEHAVEPLAPTTDTYEAQDMETAAVAAVAADHGVPFLGIRGVSDGPGDPLDLPGFPAQFFGYRHLAAENAAAVTVALLRQTAG